MEDRYQYIVEQIILEDDYIMKIAKTTFSPLDLREEIEDLLKEKVEEHGEYIDFDLIDWEELYYIIEDYY